jgi:hypothetical protein
MSFHSASDFEGMKHDLSELFVSTAAQFAKNIGLESFDHLALCQMSAALDDVAGEVLMFGADAWPESAQDGYSSNVYPIAGQDLETYPSETDPPVPTNNAALFYTLATLLVTVPLSTILSVFVPHGGALFYAFGVMGAAMVFGTRPALLLAVLSPIFHNLLDVFPTWSLTLPDKIEAICAAFYLTTALVMPWAIRNSLRLRRYLSEPKPPAPPTGARSLTVPNPTGPVSLAA